MNMKTVLHENYDRKIFLWNAPEVKGVFKTLSNILDDAFCKKS